ncbi:hypothetical protein QJS10_CPB19g01224 [Acorus calamus]|uniref:Uncharacterized protein n=1 Tax=Acorus calamus TaxID=4465 RepID=A0AAV9CJX0_ACOCL|nr:hypothetical protein QJS10_CPB19g01224 [Acorus calamus]
MAGGWRAQVILESWSSGVGGFRGGGREEEEGDQEGFGGGGDGAERGGGVVCVGGGGTRIRWRGLVREGRRVG